MDGYGIIHSAVANFHFDRISGLYPVSLCKTEIISQYIITGGNG